MAATSFPLAGALSRGLNTTRRWSAATAAAPWQPFFASGEQGCVYDPSDFTSMFQDLAGTVPVTAAGQPVGVILDLSGNGNHIVAVSNAARPELKQYADGNYYLDGDGSDNQMVTGDIDGSAFRYGVMMMGVSTASIYEPWASFQQASGTTGGLTMYGRTNAAWGPMIFAASGANGGASSVSPNGTPQGETSVVAAMRADMAQIVDYSNITPFINGVHNEPSSGSNGATNTMVGVNKLYLMKYPGGSFSMFGRLYRTIFLATNTNPSDADMTTLSDWINENSGSY